jgi:hypothetical protein
VSCSQREVRCPRRNLCQKKAPGAKSRDLLLLGLKQREDVVADCVTLLEGGIRFLIARFMVVQLVVRSPGVAPDRVAAAWRPSSPAAASTRHWLVNPAMRLAPRLTATITSRCGVQERDHLVWEAEEVDDRRRSSVVSSCRQSIGRESRGHDLLGHVLAG